MGLDSVELLIAVEDEFQIGIPDAAAGEMTKVRHLVDHVYNAIAGESNDKTLWSHLDQKYEAVIGQRISDLPPDTRIVDLLEAGQEVSQWRALRLKPWLERPPIVTGLCILTVIVLGICAVFFTKSWFPVVVTIGASWFLAARMTRPFLRIPDNELAIQDLVWWSFDPEDRKLTRESVFEKVAELIVDQLGVTKEEVVEEALFVNDLGID